MVDGLVVRRLRLEDCVVVSDAMIQVLGFTLLDADTTSDQHQSIDLGDVQMLWRPSEAASDSDTELTSQDCLRILPQPLCWWISAALNCELKVRRTMRTRLRLEWCGSDCEASRFVESGYEGIDPLTRHELYLFEGQLR